MSMKLFDSELKVMNVLWQGGDRTAKEGSDILKAETGWNMNTTYTVIKKCIAKGAIERSEPGFVCHALIPKEAVQEAETDELIGKLFDGSVDQLFAALLGPSQAAQAAVSGPVGFGSAAAADSLLPSCGVQCVLAFQPPRAGGGLCAWPGRSVPCPAVRLDGRGWGRGRGGLCL